MDRESEMTAEDAVNIIKLLEENDIEVYVDGGWGVDALLGEQTRKHDDLDIALPHRFVPQLRELLEVRGYIDVPQPDTRDCNFVLGDDKGHLVDVHSYVFDERGNNVLGVAYEPHHLTGSGTINGYPVKCPPPDVMVGFHTGYGVDKDDFHDTKAICERFGIPLPRDYEIFVMIDGLFDKDDKAAYKCFRVLEAASEQDNRVYQFFATFADMIDNDNSYIRTRGLLLISANAKWDKDNKIDEIVDKYLRHIQDEKPITSRQCIKALPKIAEFKPDLKEAICTAIEKANPGRYASSMQSLIYKDMGMALEKIRGMG